MYCTGNVRTDITEVPEVLVIKINREFMVNSKTMKDKHAVSFPDGLILNDVELLLAGVVVHIGDTIDSGHYTAYIRPDGNQWVKMDDGYTPEVVHDAAPRAMNASVLFYSRRAPAS
jgi:ubiquitin C-terminal hydrolase